MASSSDLSGLGVVRPELRSLAGALWDAATSYGYTLAIPEFGGRRSAATQTALYVAAVAAGIGGDTAYAVAKPGTSRHEYGAAVDLHIIAGGDGDGGTGADSDYRWLAETAESLGLIAGYYFDARGQGKHDQYHFQLNETLAVSRANAPAAGASFTLLFIVAAVALLALAYRYTVRKR